MHLFQDPLHDEFVAWLTGFVTAGGADYGEILAVADRLAGEVDDDTFAAAWSDVAAAHVRAADAAEAKGHAATAIGHLLRAAAADGVVVHTWFGAPVDPRLVEALDRNTSSFERAIRLRANPGEAFTFPFDGQDLKAWFVPATGSAPGEVRPLVVVTGGYDSTVADNFLGLGRAAADRGYHCVLYDGPGQGTTLVHHGMAMVPDWERVVSPLLDVVVRRSDVDPARMAIYGWSLGGYLAPRAASAEPRLAACVADPALFDVLSPMKGLVAMGISQEAADRLPEMDPADSEKLTEAIEGDRGLRWRVLKRGCWVNGASDFAEYAEAIAPFTMEGRVEAITMPFLGTRAEGDMLAAGAADFVAKVGDNATLLDFTAAEGAGGHCEFQSRWRVNTAVLDWLDEVLPAG